MMVISRMPTIIVDWLLEIVERKFGTLTTDSTSPLPMPYDKKEIRKKIPKILGAIV
jgi:hypothetical protein